MSMLPRDHDEGRFHRDDADHGRLREVVEQGGHREGYVVPRKLLEVDIQIISITIELGKSDPASKLGSYP
jgi:hypothetical protein